MSRFYGYRGRSEAHNVEHELPVPVPSELPVTDAFGVGIDYSTITSSVCHHYIYLSVILALGENSRPILHMRL